MAMRSLFRRFKAVLTPGSGALNTISLQSKNILHNVMFLQSLNPQQTIFPVLKSNAYGHGLKQICQILETAADLEYLCVDSYPERQIVRDWTTKKALIIGETLPENYRLYDTKRTALAVYNRQTVRTLASLGHPYNLHLFLNTGMNREGIDEANLTDILLLLKQHPQLHVEGVMSHLATADEVDPSFMAQQVATYKTLYAHIVAAGHAPKRRHIGNSAGYAKVADPLFTAARTGFALYGYNPFDPTDPYFDTYIPLMPALSLTSTIMSVHQINKEAPVGYGNTYTAKQPTTICTIPFGYMEGLPRAVSNKLQIRRGDEYLTSAGRISMNLSSYDAGDQPVQVGDQVELISWLKDHLNSITTLAELSGTIPYEILVKLDRGIRRSII